MGLGAPQFNGDYGQYGHLNIGRDTESGALLSKLRLGETAPTNSSFPSCTWGRTCRGSCTSALTRTTKRSFGDNCIPKCNLGTRCFHSGRGPTPRACVFFRLGDLKLAVPHHQLLTQFFLHQGRQPQNHLLPSLAIHRRHVGQ